MNILIATRIKELRRDRDITQAQLATALGTTQRKVSYWESDRFEPDIHML